jgi:hypothetical protein
MSTNRSSATLAPQETFMRPTFLGAGTAGRLAVWISAINA